MNESLDSAQAYEALFLKSEQWRAQGELLRAFTGYQQLLSQSLYEMGGNTQAFSNYDAIVTERLADLSGILGYHQAAERLLEALEQLSAEAGNLYLYFYMVVKRATIAIDANRLEEGFGQLGQLQRFIGELEDIPFQELPKWEKASALPVENEEQKAVLFIRLYYAMGIMLQRLGQYRDSLKSLERAFYYAQRSPGTFNAGTSTPIRLALCQSLMEKGQVRKASQLVGELEADCPPDGLLNSRLRWLELKAKLSLMSGALGNATGCFEEIIRHCRAKGLARPEVAALTNLAQFKILINQVAEALELLEAAADIARHQTDAASSAHIEALRQLAQARATSLVPGAAISTSFSSSLTSRQEGKSRPASNLPPMPEVEQDGYYLAYYENRELVFKSRLAQMDWEQAARYLEEMEEFFGPSDSTLIRHRLQVLRLSLDYYQQGGGINTPAAQEALHCFRQEGLLPELWELQRLLSWDPGLEPEAVRALQSANETLLEQLANSLPPESQAIFLLNKWTEEEIALARKADALVQNWMKWRRKPFLLRALTRGTWKKQLNALFEEIGFHKQRLIHSNLNGDKTVPKANGQSRPLSKSQVEIGFLVLPDRILTLFRGRRLAGFVLAPASRVQLREEVKAFHQLLFRLTDARSLAPRDLKECKENLLERGAKQARKLARLLRLEEVLEQLPARIRRITIIPDDVIHGLPFAMFPYQGKYLIERYALSVSYSQLPRPNSYRGRNAAFLLGYSYPNSADALPGVPRELEAVQSVLGQQQFAVQCLLDQVMDNSSLKPAMQSARLAHIACHGIFDPQQPGQSGLLLPNGGRISLRNILEQQLFFGLAHVTLSSCWAADHFILPGRLVISLPETICRSGAGSVLACFWEVSDQVAVPFMKLFYQNLQRYPRDLAFQQTQLATLRNQLPGAGQDTRNPFFWAGFNLYGAVGKW